MGLLATTTRAPVPAVIVAGRDPVAMEVTVPDEFIEVMCFAFELPITEGTGMLEAGAS